MTTVDPELLRENATIQQLNERFAPTETIVEEKKRGPGRPKKEVTLDDSWTDLQKLQDERQLFIQGMLTVMNAYQAKAPNQVRQCVAAAEEFVKIVKEKY